MKVTPCMGGFCQLREECQHYTSPSTREHPVEKLCDTGAEREMYFRPQPGNSEASSALIARAPAFQEAT